MKFKINILALALFSCSINCFFLSNILSNAISYPNELKCKKIEISSNGQTYDFNSESIFYPKAVNSGSTDCGTVAIKLKISNPNDMFKKFLVSKDNNIYCFPYRFMDGKTKIKKGNIITNQEISFTAINDDGTTANFKFIFAYNILNVIFNNNDLEALKNNWNKKVEENKSAIIIYKNEIINLGASLSVANLKLSVSNSDSFKVYDQISALEKKRDELNANILTATSKSYDIELKLNEKKGILKVIQAQYDELISTLDQYKSEYDNIKSALDIATSENTSNASKNEELGQIVDEKRTEFIRQINILKTLLTGEEKVIDAISAPVIKYESESLEIFQNTLNSYAPK